MCFAIINNSKVVAIVGIFPSNWLQFEEVVVANSNVQVGDDYILGKFYRNGEEVLSTEELLIEDLGRSLGQISQVIPVYRPNKVYHRGDFVQNNLAIYYCLGDTTYSPPNTSYWRLSSLEEYFNSIQ